MSFLSAAGQFFRSYCRVSILFIKKAHNSAAITKITSKGQRLFQINVLSVKNAYPHVAGNNLPAITNALGSISLGNMIPESIVEGRNNMIDIIDVFAVLFAAKPITLAMLSDTAIRVINPAKYVPGCAGIFASKATGAMT